MYPPDGLLTLEEVKHDVELNPHIIAPDPFASDDRFDVVLPIRQFLLTNTIKEPSTMNTSEDEPSSGLNGRLRPRKSFVPSPQTSKVTRKSDGKQDKAKKLTTPTKTTPNKPDDLSNKSDFSPTPQFLCPYCDRKFASKQTLSKHARRMHFSNSKQDSFIKCLFCDVSEANSNQIIRHMLENHSDVYFACLHCHSRLPSMSELAEHKLNVCEKQKPSYRSKLRQKGSAGAKKTKKANVVVAEEKLFEDRRFNGVVISCELKPSQVHDGADIEDNITTNLILPPKSLGNSSALEKNAVIVLDDIQWNKRIPPNFSFHNSDADQILSRLGVVHRSPRTAESNRRDWLRALDDSTQKFEKCFDTSFYSKVASNVQENLSKFLDGSFNFNPDPDNTIKTRKSKNSVVINAAEGFPILLASQQYSRNLFDGYMPRAVAPKHKWKWDNLENDKNVLNPDQIKRDSHTNNCIITLVSRLDIWTQLSMRRKYEEKFNIAPPEKKTQKRNNISKQLKEILESREIPTTVRSAPVTKPMPKPTTSSRDLDFPSLLGLTRTVEVAEQPAAVLSGEWVRPRCYVCCACGAQTRDSRSLAHHIQEHHPHAQVQHYEIVGERLLDSDIMKHLYVPPSQVCNRTRPSRGFRDCTKCSKSITLEDLHQHMLDCAGDTPTVRRRQCRYRPFGVRKRRPRLPDNTIRKKIRSDIRSRQKRQKSHLRSRPKIRTEVGDAETIRKMIADLPAKRHRILANPTNQNVRPRRNVNQLRNKIIMKKRPSDDSSNRKRCATRFASLQPSKHGESSSNFDKTNNMSSKEDDEDNKPLKTPMKRVINTRTRQNEFVQRKSVMSKAKRKPTLVKARDKKIEKLVDTADGSNSSEVKKCTLDDSPEKIDVKEAAYNTREHANRGSSNNRDIQRPGCSRPNGNSNNGDQPTQNVPLKHSIARLTANSETHDKSVQFSHSFLVQQECNNANQHLPSDQQILFENEAAITRLDKPPLNFDSRGSVDYYSLQKSKLNKPRKKLNDCIAMLKNKLVDPLPSVSTSQVSVQCGSDDPIELEPLVPLQRTAEFEDPKITFTAISMPPNESTENSPVESDCKNNAPIHKLADIDQPPKSDQNVTTNLQNDMNSPVIDTPVKPKQKSGSKKTASRVADGRPVPVPQKTKKARPETEIISPKCALATSTPHKSSKLVSQYDSNLPSPVISMQADLNKKPLKDLPKKSDEVKEKPIPSEPKNTREKSLEKPTPINSSLIELIPTEACVPTHVTKPQQASSPTHVTKPQQASTYPEYKEMPCKPTDLQTEHQSSIKDASDDGFSENVFACFSECEMQMEIPPAHASTHIESIVMTPLDLSGKMQNFNNSNDASLQENIYCAHECYETLDLSNKADDRLRQETVEMTDVVVDLSVKPFQPECTLDLCTKSKNLSPTEEMNAAEFDNVPTDLSIKGRAHGSSFVYPGNRTDDINYVQDLSANKANFSKIGRPLPLTEAINEFPTDLSGKSSIEKPLAQINETSFKHSMMNLQDLAENISFSNVPKESQIQMTGQLETCKKPLINEINQERAESVPTHINDETPTQPKPVYDPTLKIPQYKIRAASSTTTTASDTAARFGSKIQSNLEESSPKDNSAVISTPERLPLDLESATLNTPISTSAGTVPVYALQSRALTSTVGKYESTTPVYTLANACISVTKIEPVSSASLTNTLLSIPMTTIANTTSVYTLAGTTVGVPINYGVISNTGSNVTSTANNSCIRTSKPILVESDETHSMTQRLDVGSKQDKKNIEAINMDQDAETARKIAMLPKELVDILGNMPIDHRNQLLNVLPQYVTTTSSTSVSQTETVQTITNTSTLTFQKTAPHTGTKQVENNTVSTPDLQVECLSNTPSDLPSAHQVSKASYIPMSGQIDYNKKHSTVPSMSPPMSPPINYKIETDDIKTLPVHNSQNLNFETNIGDVKLPLRSVTNRSLKMNEYENLQDRVIDLTCDDNVSANADAVKIAEDLSRSITMPVQEIANFATNGKINKQKVNNDQTASLRAVRIKAPSVRQKENQMLKSSPVEQHSTPPTPDDNEANKLSESNKYLAIQQAEISSTQHGNKNMSTEPKCAPKMPLTVANADDQTIKTRRMSSCENEIVTKSDKFNQNAEDTQNLVNKTVLVTSSISVSQVSCEEKSKTIPDDKNNSLDSAIRGMPQSGNQFAETPIINICEDTKVVESDVNKSEALQDVQVVAADPKDNKQEDDSDDDVSLAVIVKQKQQQIVMHPGPKSTNKVEKDKKVILKGKKKMRGKKQKSKMSKDESLPDLLPTVTVSGSVEPTEDSNVGGEKIVTTDFITDEQTTTSTIASDFTDVKEVTKSKKTNSKRKFVTSKNSEKLNSDCDVAIKCSQIGKETKALPTDERDIQTSGIPEVTEAPVSSDVSKPTQNDANEKIKTTDVYPFAIDTGDMNESVEKKIKLKAPKKKKRAGTFSDVENKEISDTCSHGSEKITLSEKLVVEEDLQVKHVTNITEVLSTIRKSTGILETPVIEVENVNSSSDTKPYKKNTRTKKLSETEVTDINCSVLSGLCTRQDEENTSTPLRRSRRGKSLYVEGLSPRLENVVKAESLSENSKVPLTKKQLIFSKLLLDEENHINPVHSSDTESSNLEKSVNLTNADESSTAEPIPHISHNNDATELSHDKIKSVKRKNSPHFKQKHKKKKLVKYFQTSEINTPIDSTQHDSNSSLKDSSERDSSMFDSSKSATENVPETKVLPEENILDESRKADKIESVFNGLGNTINHNSNIDDTVSKSTSSEKRKICTTINIECGSKPKKSKLMKNKESTVIDQFEITDVTTDEVSNKTKKDVTIAEHRNTACYSMPVAARRTRSKSVVVKSSVENLYDPYNIDLDDMLGDSEPLRKKRTSLKETKKASKVKTNNVSKEHDNDLANNVPTVDPVDIQTPKKNKTDSILIIPHNISKNKLTKSNTKNMKKIDSEMMSSREKSNKQKLTSACVDTSEDILDETMESTNKDESIDSDDSTKSDVPLKRYVEEKEKKIAVLSKSSDKVNEVTPKSLNKRLAGPSFESSKLDSLPDEAQEELRSEQFMESFGFFSERKPRKSNLLASKKISETFHIIANESDDVYFGIKARPPKKQIESRKSVEGESSGTQSTSKKSLKKERKKNTCVEATTCYCGICKKEFQRPDNYIRHQLTLLHVSKMSELELNVKTVSYDEEPSYLTVYKKHLERFKVITDIVTRQRKTSKPKIVLPPMTDIVAELSMAVRHQLLLRRGLTRDEALFVDCCELLKESHKTEGLHVPAPPLEANVSTTCPECPARIKSPSLDLLEKLISEDREDTKSDGDVDSITAKNILESEEVRNLENDLISGLQEAANSHKQNSLNYQQAMASMNIGAANACVDKFSGAPESHYDNMDEFDMSEPPSIKTKEKMYPDITEIDLFEDKFDKIKRKCRSQAAAAKQNQTIVETCSSHKGRKKSDKKKGKKGSKKNFQNTVLTKGALKGFDGIKVSIPTSDINMPAIVQPHEMTQKKKKKPNSKKKREKRFSESHGTYDMDNRGKDGSFSQKKVDVYEFMDNEDAELFEFRPSTLMERFKSISNKDVPSTSKLDSAADDAEASSESGSDGDDFVYMSDDYMCSDDETENSLMSCEMANLKVESKKYSPPLKRKDVVEKNAVMGKIFKNAVRAEKKIVKAKETVSPKANLDQLFDSLLEEEPSSSMLNNDSESLEKDDFDGACLDTVITKHKSMTRKSIDEEIASIASSEKHKNDVTFVSPKRKSTSPKTRVLSPSKPDFAVSQKYDSDYSVDFGPSTSKKQDITSSTLYGPSTSKKYVDDLRKPTKGLSKKREKTSSKKYDRSPSDYGGSSPSRSNDMLFETDKTKYEQLNDDNAEYDQEMSDAGVARQRARRKCTVGKQNVLAETWSSESEPDGALPRSNSSESIVGGVRKKKGRKKDGQPHGGRRVKHVAFKKQDIECRVTSSNRNASSSAGVGGNQAGPVEAAAAVGAASTAGAPGRAYSWSSEGDEEQERLQQHGWIVGDSHKKLVTMLAHAKGRKRNNDDKRHLVE